jgi:hypothetical protein
MTEEFRMNETQFEKPSGQLPNTSADGLRTSLRNIGVLIILIIAILAGLGTLLALGTLADKNVEKIHRRLESQRKMRQPPDTTPIAIPPGKED